MPSNSLCTAEYLSPETFRLLFDEKMNLSRFNRRYATTRDVWAMGIVLLGIYSEGICAELKEFLGEEVLSPTYGRVKRLRCVKQEDMNEFFSKYSCSDSRGEMRRIRDNTLSVLKKMLHVNPKKRPHILQTRDALMEIHIDLLTAPLDMPDAETKPAPVISI